MLKLLCSLVLRRVCFLFELIRSSTKEFLKNKKLKLRRKARNKHHLMAVTHLEFISAPGYTIW